METYRYILTQISHKKHNFNKLMRSGIYKWTSPSGKSYVGQAVDLDRRYREFKYSLNAKPYTKLGSAIDNARHKYSDFESWKYEVLEEIDTTGKNNVQIKAILDKKEIYYIEKYNTYRKGYNSTAGGGGTLGFHVPRDLLIKAFKKRRSYKGKNNPNYGKKHSKEAIEKMRQARLGIKPTREALLKKSKPVNQYDLDGNFIRTWELGASEAMRALYIDKSTNMRVCKGKTAGGFKWGYLS